MKVYCVQLLFYLIAVYYMIYLIYNLIFLYIETKEMKEKTIENLTLLVKTKEGKLIIQQQSQVQCCQYFTYRSSPSKCPWVLTVHLEFEKGGHLHTIFQKRFLISTHL